MTVKNGRRGFAPAVPNHDPMPRSEKSVLIVIAFIATVLTLGVVDISELNDPIAAIGALFVFLIANPRIGVSVLILLGIIVFIGMIDRP